MTVSSVRATLRFSTSRNPIMKRSLAIVCLGLFAAAGSAQESFGTIVRKDPAFDKLIPQDAKIEKLATGFKWVEGPVWVKNGGFLLFSDIPNNAIHQWTPGKG